MDYTLTDFSQVDDFVQQVLRLQNRAFAEYEGAMKVDQDFVEWYSRRPGTEFSICQAALDGDRLIAQVIISKQPLQLGGEILSCGIIDSVATDPDYQKQGLASTLMDRAHEAMIEAGIDAAVLYTNPDDHPYHFYRKLGYAERARASLLLGPRTGDSGCGAAPVDAAQQSDGLRMLLNHYYAGYEGFSPLTDELWQWHKVDTPGERTVVAEMGVSGPISTATFANAPVQIEGHTHEVSVAYDLAAQVMNADQFASLLSAAPREMIALTLDDISPERQWADDLGFEPAVAEVSMVLPFTDVARKALQDRQGPWYVMVESVTGV